MKIYIANDHGGYNLKKKLMNYLDCSFEWNPSEKSERITKKTLFFKSVFLIFP